jgi:hypothetical protein
LESSKGFWRDPIFVSDLNDLINRLSTNNAKTYNPNYDGDANQFQIYNFSAFLDIFFDKKVKDISKMHQFVFSKENKGSVLYKEYSDTNDGVFSCGGTTTMRLMKRKMTNKEKG